ncbi:hypothetical protein SDC9_168168 [bioreactor metagenome]|uniref:Uncharacterized protein n=1 Tax=bioreactor metagenome TaxID=1076179 RepID=A0A645G4S3_9ZZZZ
MRVERVVLEDHRDVAVFGGHIVDESVAAVEFTFGDLFEPGDHAQSRRLAAARGPDQHDELFVRDVKRKLLHRYDIFVVDLLDVLECNVCHVFSALAGATFVHRPTRVPPVKCGGRITAGLHTAAPQAMRLVIPPLFSVAAAKKWSKRRALGYKIGCTYYCRFSPAWQAVRHNNHAILCAFAVEHTNRMNKGIIIFPSAVDFSISLWYITFCTPKGNVAG